MSSSNTLSSSPKYRHDTSCDDAKNMCPLHESEYILQGYAYNMYNYVCV